MTQRRIFSLSIDENISWAAAHVDIRTGKYAEIATDEEVEYGIFCGIPPDDKIIDLDALIRSELFKLSKERPSLFSDTFAVGVSTIGVVDPDEYKLVGVRQEWKRHKDESGKRQTYICDFGKVIRECFNNNSIRVSVHNNTTAKCLYEAYLQHDTGLQGGLSPVDRLFYATFQTGVNGSFVHRIVNHGQYGKPVHPNRVLSNEIQPIATRMHQELGHIFPQLHPRDHAFDETKSGCQIHKRCFLGLAGGKRIERQWGNLAEHPEAWEIIAYYIAHFCWNAVLTLPPERILLGGPTVFPELLDCIRDEFKRINHYKGLSYIDYPALNSPRFIEMGLLPPKTSGVLSGLELARRAGIGAPIHGYIDGGKTDGSKG